MSSTCFSISSCDFKHPLSSDSNLSHLFPLFSSYSFLISSSPELVFVVIKLSTNFTTSNSILFSLAIFLKSFGLKDFFSNFNFCNFEYAFLTLSESGSFPHILLVFKSLKWVLNLNFTC